MQIESVHSQISPANKYFRCQKMRRLPVYCQWLRRVLTFGTLIYQIRLLCLTVVVGGDQDRCVNTMTR